MIEFLYTLAIIFAIFGASFLLLNVRYIFTKQEFRGTCASNSEMLKNQIGECSICGKKADEACQMPEVKGA
jgi:hypothetical protein